LAWLSNFDLRQPEGNLADWIWLLQIFWDKALGLLIPGISPWLI
jgi:hypothetical protein